MSAPLSTSSSVSSSSAIAGASSRSAEVEKVEFETRMRQLIVELLEPTIKRVSRHEAEGAAIRKQLAKHADALKESQTLAVQAQQQLATVDYFKEELAKWDTQRRNQEAKVAEDIAFMRQDLDSFRLDLERKDGSIESLQRMNDRMNTQVTRVIELQDQHSQHTDERADKIAKQLHQMRRDVELQIVGLQTKHDTLADELWGEETGLAKVAGELQRTNEVVAELSESSRHLEATKASTDQLDAVQKSNKEGVQANVRDLQVLRQSVTSVVTEVKEHFQTASNTISAHNATMLSEVRQAYQEELQHAAQVRADIVKFSNETAQQVANVQKDVETTREQMETKIEEVHNEVEDLNGKRHRDKSSQDIEVRQLKKRLGGVFDNSDLVLKSLEHLSSVVSMVLESNRVAVALEIQDDIDRRRVALMGYKESQASGGSSGSGSTTARQSRASVGRGGSVSVSTGGPGGAMPPVISLDQRCVSCSGQSTTVLAGFKIACLQYHPGPITYNAKVRAEFIPENQTPSRAFKTQHLHDCRASCVMTRKEII
eukprot:GHVT01102132.1.p1 GENE.GHVT01102132.1~~GHVT01102132.1.p1  ORF type:complete len:570 (-),score=82.48 GHVT01102132.1:1026-2651(-)